MSAKRKQIWIGMVEVRPLGRRGRELLENAKGAFIDVVTWASGPDEYRSNAARLFSDLDLFVVDVENDETLEARERKKMLTFEIEDMVERARSNPGAIIYGTFHLWSRDDA